ncbi:MAG: hypothetical protein WCK35_14545 [Chloroflexota bacterium]
MSENLFARTLPLPIRPIPETYWVIPGRMLAGEYPGVHFSAASTRRRLDAFLEARFNTFINLTCLGEMEDYEFLLREEAGYYASDIKCLRFAIGDYGLPEAEMMSAILDAIDTALDEERKVYLHCFGGIGRTGTVVGCYLVRHGYTGRQALRQLAEWWREVPKSVRQPCSPETARQADFVLRWQEIAG